MDNIIVLNEGELDSVSGGHPFLVGLGAVASYIAILDVAADFGAGLGAGIYDATH